MRSPHRLLCVAAGLAVLTALTLGCAPSEDESADIGRGPVAPPAAVGSGLAGGLPSPDVAVQLDPVTKARCDAVWSLGVFVYSAHLANNPSPAERDKLAKGVSDNEPKASQQVPEMAGDFKALADHSLQALRSPNGLQLTPQLSDANQRLVDYLRVTCKFKSA